MLSPRSAADDRWLRYPALGGRETRDSSRTAAAHIRQPDAPTQQLVLENSLLLRASTAPVRS